MKSTLVRRASLSIAAISFLFTSVRARAADPARIAEGKRYFAVGVALVNDPDGARYEDALVQFKKAFDVLGAWKVLVNIGICSLRLERDGEAIEAYEKYLVAGGAEIDKSERDDIERDLGTLRVQLVRLHLDLRSAGGTVADERMDARGTRIVNRYPSPQRSVDLGVHPGHHLFTIQAGGREVRWEIDLAPGTSVSHTFDVGEPTAEAGGERGPSNTSATTRILTYGAFGAGVVGLGIGTAFAVRSHNSRTQVDGLCPDDRCPLARHDEISDLQSQASTAGKIAAAAFVFGGIAVATGGTLFVVTRSRESKPEKVSVSPWVGPAALGLAGTF